MPCTLQNNAEALLHIDADCEVSESGAMQIRAKRTDNLRRILEVVIIVTITVGAIFLLASFLGTCVEVPTWQEQGYGYTFHCPDGAALSPCLRDSEALTVRATAHLPISRRSLNPMVPCTLIQL